MNKIQETIYKIYGLYYKLWETPNTLSIQEKSELVNLINNLYRELQQNIRTSNNNEMLKIWNDFSPVVELPLAKYDKNIHQWILDLWFDTKISPELMKIIRNNNNR